MSIGKTVIRVAVIGALATGATVLVAGPHRVMALAGQARQAVIQKIDKNIKDPVALRTQLRTLEAEYPKRIGAVRSDLVELQGQLSALERDRDVARKVVEMATADLSTMKDVLAKADEARTESPYAVINVRFGGRTLSLDQAYTRATQINSTVGVYTTQVTSAERDIGLLRQQQERLEEMLTQLETERAQFQAQVWQLDGQIEMIARNDKLIEMVEARQQTLDKFSRYEAVSLDQVTSKMNSIRAEQEARLQGLMNQEQTTDYHKAAEAMLDAETLSRSVFENSLKAPVGPAPASQTIEVTPKGSRTLAPGEQVALNKTIVVDR